jgi:hypothetical protein
LSDLNTGTNIIEYKPLSKKHWWYISNYYNLLT